MGSSQNPIFLISIYITFLILQTSSTDNTKLIFKGCSDQKIQDPGSEIFSNTLNSLFTTLSSKSTNTLFSSTTVSSSDQNQTSIYGLYQCRGDLTPTDCNNCVNKIPSLASKLCEKSIAARIHLFGCYLRYELVGFKQVSNTELLYKVCGSKNEVNLTEFERVRDLGFEKGEKGVQNGGFYTGSFENFYVLGQCEGDLSSGDCVDCVSRGFDVVKGDCGDSVSGQAYLQKCYVSYAFYSNGAPSQGTNEGQKQGTKKIVAMAVGGLAAIGFGIVCLLFIRSVFKKRESKHGHY